MNKTICHISFNHDAFDDRIYWKELLSLKKAGYNPVHISIQNEDADYVSAEGIRIICIKRITRHRNIYINRLLHLLIHKNSTMERIFNIAAEMKAAIYHYHDLQINALSERLKGLPHQPKVIYDSHEAYHLLHEEAKPKNNLLNIPYSIYTKLINSWELKKASKCHQIIVTDQYTYNYFKHKLPQIPCTILFNYSYFDTNVRPDVKKYDFIYTGLLNRARGIEEMIKATIKLQMSFPEIKLLLIGRFETDNYKKLIEKEILDKSLQKTIIVKDQVSFKEIATYYNQSKIGLGLFQKTPKYETFIPIKLFEYMAFGLPVIFSNFGPSADIIKETQCGCIVDTYDLEAITFKMKELLNNSKLYYQMSNNAKMCIDTKYHWKNEELKLLRTYETLLN